MIEVSGLYRKFNDLTALEDVSFASKGCEVIGLLGPNGAGKTTLMRVLAGILAPSAGSVAIGGRNIRTDASFKWDMGYMPENSALYDDMTVVSYLRFMAQARGFSGRTAKAAIGAAAEKARIADMLGRRIETLSKGYKRRVSLAQALLHDPNILILDEPTEGLDPNQKSEFYELAERLGKEKLVIISTHALEEVSYVCTRILLINKGRVILDTPKAGLDVRPGETLGAFFHRLTVGGEQA